MGSRLIEHTLDIARDTFPFVFVIGDENYYHRFGFESASKYNLYLHGTDSKEEFEDFIGRESIIDKLKGWLYDAREDNKRHTTKYSGAYLITGFRGMGKSSFVHKTIHEIQTQKITKKKYGNYLYLRWDK